MPIPRNANLCCAHVACQIEVTKAIREALLDAADHLLPGDLAGPEFLVYLAVTRYGAASYDPEMAQSLIRHRSFDELLIEADKQAQDDDNV